nr:MAG TPA: hypothetical protein [Crassvirales sp.]
MTNEEFSNEFDVLYNSITSNQAPGLDEYEKSVFLTKAQSEILREYFNSRVDGTNGGFDGSQKRQYDFSFLIKTASLEANLTSEDDEHYIHKIDDRGYLFNFPEDYFLSINEVIRDDESSNRFYSVVSISYSDYQRLMTKPYAYPPKRVAWRLFIGTIQETLEDSSKVVTIPVAEIIGKFVGKSDNWDYTLRYVKKPNPIILINLTDDNLSIEGKKEETPCEFPSQLHQEILERAVTLAKIAYQTGSTATIAAQSNKNNQQQ